MYLQHLINSVAEDMKEEHGYSSVECIDYVMDDDGSDSNYLSYVVSFEVG